MLSMSVRERWNFAVVVPKLVDVINVTPNLECRVFARTLASQEVRKMLTKEQAGDGGKGEGDGGSESW